MLPKDKQILSKTAVSAVCNAYTSRSKCCVSCRNFFGQCPRVKLHVEFQQTRIPDVKRGQAGGGGGGGFAGNKKYCPWRTKELAYLAFLLSKISIGGNNFSLHKTVVTVCSGGVFRRDERTLLDASLVCCAPITHVKALLGIITMGFQGRYVHECINEDLGADFTHFFRGAGADDIRPCAFFFYVSRHPPA